MCGSALCATLSALRVADGRTATRADSRAGRAGAWPCGYRAAIARTHPRSPSPETRHCATSIRDANRNGLQRPRHPGRPPADPTDRRIPDIGRPSANNKRHPRSSASPKRARSSRPRSGVAAAPALTSTHCNSEMGGTHDAEPASSQFRVHLQRRELLEGSLNTRKMLGTLQRLVDARIWVE